MSVASSNQQTFLVVHADSIWVFCRRLVAWDREHRQGNQKRERDGGRGYNPESETKVHLD